MNGPRILNPDKNNCMGTGEIWFLFNKSYFWYSTIQNYNSLFFIYNEISTHGGLCNKVWRKEKKE